MNTSALLKRLEEQLDRLTRELAPVASQVCLYPRFPADLFRCNARVIQDYLQEISANMHRLTQLAQRQNRDGLEWLAQRVLDQITALCREAVSWSLRINDHDCQPVGKLYASLLHLQQERVRLLAIKDTDDVPFTQRDLPALQHLLDRNQSATWRLERALIRYLR